MSGMMISRNGVLIIQQTTEAAVTETEAAPGDWFFIPKMQTVGRLEKSNEPLFVEEGFFTLFVPANGVQGSFTADELEPLEPSLQFYSQFSVGDLVHFHDYGRNEIPFPQVYDKEYEDYFTLDKDDVGVVIEATLFYIRVRFGEVYERTYNPGTEKQETVYYTSFQMYDDIHLYLAWNEDVPEEERTEILQDHRTHVTIEDFDGDIVTVLMRDNIHRAGDKRIYKSVDLERINWCQKCGSLVPEDGMYYDDECSLRALRGEPTLNICDGCREEYTAAYTFKVIGDEVRHKDEESYYIFTHTSTIEGCPDIVDEFINAYDFEKEELTGNSFIDLRSQTFWLSSTDSSFENALKDIINDWHRKGYSTHRSTFTILDVNDTAYLYIRRSEICYFAAWLLMMERKGRLGEKGLCAADFLTDYMPTKEQIVGAFKDGTEPVFPFDVPYTPVLGLVTLRELHNLGACSDEMIRFNGVFPDGCEVTIENVQKAVDAGLPVTWCVSAGFSVAQRARYARDAGFLAERIVNAYWYKEEGNE
jgi:hypothetical protein